MKTFPLRRPRGVPLPALPRLGCKLRPMNRRVLLIAAAVLLPISAILFLPLLFTWSDSAPSAGDYQSIYSEGFTKVLEPHRAAAAAADPACLSAPLHMENPSCAQFVDALRAIQESLPSLTSRLSALLGHGKPPGVSDASLAADYRILNLMQTMQRENELLIKGWDDHDEASWSGAWEIASAVSAGNPLPSPSTTPMPSR